MTHFVLSYNPNVAVAIVQTYNLGSHQVNLLSDHTITISDNKIDMPEYDFEAQEATRLDHDEAYKLLIVLHEMFK